MSSVSFPFPASRHEWSWLVACLLLQSCLIVHADFVHPVMVDEGAHVLSGLCYLKAGTTDLYHVNPPLAKALCAAPLFLHPEFVWPAFPATATRGTRSLEWLPVFQGANRGHLQALTVLGRLPLLAFSLGTTLVIWAWGRSLWGPVGAGVAVALWALDPLNLAWSSCVTTDAAAAFAFTLTLWLAWRDRHFPSWRGTLGWATALGAALLCKFSLLVLIPLLVVLLLLEPGWRTWRGVVAGGLGVAWALLLVNLAYGIVGTGTPMGKTPFHSQFLAGRSDGLPGNRFAGTWFGAWPSPLPRDYWSGLDLQKTHADIGLRNYLCGEWKRGGWPHYYLVCLAVKLPLGTWFLAAVATGLAVCSPRFRLDWRKELWLALPPLAVFLLISSQTGINGYFRYLLPMLPLVFLCIGRVGRLVEIPPGASRGRWWLRLLVLAVPLVWMAVSVGLNHPQHLAYFNEAAGGPARGGEWLLDSNLDWGQDLYRLRDWVAAHPQTRPLFVACRSGANLDLLGVEAAGPDVMRFTPGWYALSVCYVRGKDGWLLGTDGKLNYFQPGTFSMFQKLTPAVRIGTSILVYRLEGPP